MGGDSSARHPSAVLQWCCCRVVPSHNERCCILHITAYHCILLHCQRSDYRSALHSPSHQSVPRNSLSPAILPGTFDMIKIFFEIKKVFSNKIFSKIPYTHMMAQKCLHWRHSNCNCKLTKSAAEADIPRYSSFNRAVRRQTAASYPDHNSAPDNHNSNIVLGIQTSLDGGQTALCWAVNSNMWICW